MKNPKKQRFSVIDLFSGAGGMSFGFHRHPRFKIAAAADAEKGKPSAGAGALQCNRTYRLNIGVTPTQIDLGSVAPTDLRGVLGLDEDFPVDVLSTCPPCTGFSRAVPDNHLRDDERNSLVRKSADFAIALGAKIVVMENARELIRGNFTHHFDWFRDRLQRAGYTVSARNYMLNKFGLPQIRERALVVAVAPGIGLETMDDLWEGWAIDTAATTVRRTFQSLTPGVDSADAFPDFATEAVRERMAAIPKDGGSWLDLRNRPDSDRLLTDAMKRLLARNKLGSYPDVYGRMAWNKPAPTIKRECAHVGNGRYAHPEENRLCSVREIAALQGFPEDFVFEGASLSNLYRHIGDAVPPLVSYQLAHLVAWMLTGERPDPPQIILPGTNLRKDDITPSEQLSLSYA